MNKDTFSKKIEKHKNGKSLKRVALKAIDRLGNESDFALEKIN